ncbi:MAG: B12-binding domain-containing radical SAM protein [Candidatus Sumerlaeia bacterium]|nr:B12-binding domain-containing radical SAM protein [Candidatus Sumerlaeia bacterium]
MKIKLINPARKPEWKENFWEFRTLRKITGRPAASPSLALLTLAAATPDGVEVVIADEHVAPIDFDEPVDLVAITSFTCIIERAYEIAGEFRRRGVPVVVGGMHASFFPEEAAQFCDAVVIGEADEIWPRVVRDAEPGCLQKVYRSERLPDLTRLPPPRWDILPRHAYCYYSVQTTRGCPHYCEFCLVTAFSGRQYRRKRIEQVVAEIAALLQTAPNESLLLADDNLLAAPNYAAPLLRELASLPTQPWVCQSSINNLQDDSILDLLRRAGCMYVFVGFESLSPDAIARMGKQRTNVVAHYKETIRRVHAHGIAVVGSFMLTPDDNADSVRRLADFIEETAMAFPMINILTPVPGSRLFDQNLANGNITIADWKRFDGEHVCLDASDALEHLRAALLAELYRYDKVLGRLRQNWSQNVFTRRACSHPRALERRGLLPFLPSMVTWDFRRIAFLIKCLCNRNRPDLASVVHALNFHDYAQSLQ